MNIQKLACLALCLIVTGCGFHLRGSGETAKNINALSITSASQYGKLVRTLQDEMRVQHIADSGQQAWHITILDEEMKENVLAYSDTNNAATLELELTVRFTVTNHTGETMIAPNTERVVRVYESNNQRRLAMERETQLLKSELYQEMAGNLLRRIDFIAAQQQ